jgi:hypothetical protein
MKYLSVIADSILKVHFSEWLHLRSLARFDSACTNIFARMLYLEVVENLRIVSNVFLRLDRSLHSLKYLFFSNWISQRQIVLTDVELSLCSQRFLIPPLFLEHNGIRNFLGWSINENNKEISGHEMKIRLDRYQEEHSANVLTDQMNKLSSVSLSLLQLASITIVNVPVFNNKSDNNRLRFVYFLNRFTTQLTSLSIIFVDHDDKVITAIDKNILSRLTHLNLQSTNESVDITVQTLLFLSEKCDSLKNFSLKCNYSNEINEKFLFPPTSIVVFLANLHQLRCVELKCQGKITSVMLNRISTHQPHLSTIHLLMHWELSDFSSVVDIIRTRSVSTPVLSIKLGAVDQRTHSYLNNRRTEYNFVYCTSSANNVVNLCLQDNLSEASRSVVTLSCETDHFNCIDKKGLFRNLRNLSHISLDNDDEGYDDEFLSFICGQNPNLRDLKVNRRPFDFEKRL